MSVCCFAGHRDAEETIRPILDESIKWHILTKGVTEFLVETYGNFDRMASASVLERKKEYPYLRLTLLVAYPPARKRSFLSGYDQVIYPEGLELEPPRFAIPALNRYMIEKSDSRIHGSLSGSVQIQGKGDPGLPGIPFHRHHPQPVLLLFSDDLHVILPPQSARRWNSRGLSAAPTGQICGYPAEYRPGLPWNNRRYWIFS